MLSLQFQKILNSLPFAVTIVALDGTVLYFNESAIELYKVEKDQIGQKIAGCFWQNPTDRLVFLDEIRKRGSIKNYEMRMQNLKGETFWGFGSGLFIDYEGQEAILSTQVEADQLIEAKKALEKSEEKYKFIADFASDVIWINNKTKGKFTYISPSVKDARGYEPQEIIGLDFKDIMTPASWEKIESFIACKMEEFYASPGKSTTFVNEIEQKHKDGSIIWSEISARIRYNEKNEIEILGINRDITERKKTEEKIKKLSYHDPLTGLYNRRYYEEKFEELDTPENLPISLIVADVNGLKLANDAFGHKKGDELLKRFANVLKGNIRDSDLLARVGGDEFVIILPKTQEKIANMVIERIKKELKYARREDVLLSMSMGSSIKRSENESLAGVFARAERDMYLNKLYEGQEMRKDTIKMIVDTIYRRFPEDQNYNKSISHFAAETGAALGLSENDISDLEKLGSIHNIGKIIDEKDESYEFKKYPESGYQILKSTAEFASLAEYILSHHERYDGSGGPRGLKGEDIPLLSRILNVAESWVDLQRQNKGVEDLRAQAGKELDGKIVDIFIKKVLEEE